MSNRKKPKVAKTLTKIEEESYRVFTAGWDCAIIRAVSKANAVARLFERLDYSKEPEGLDECGQYVAMMMRQFSKDLRLMLLGKPK